MRRHVVPVLLHQDVLSMIYAGHVVLVPSLRILRNRVRVIDNLSADARVVLLPVKHLAHLLLALLLVLQVHYLNDNVVLTVRKHLLDLRLRKERACGHLL